MRWTTAAVATTDLDDAVSRAADQIAVGLDGEAPDVLLAFATPPLADDAETLAERLAARFPSAARVGCSASGVIGGGEEIEGRPALSLVAAVMPGVTARPFHLSEDPETWPPLGLLGDGERPLVVLLPDPFSCDVPALLRNLDDALPGAVVVGGLASGGRRPAENALLVGERVLDRGVVGLSLSGALSVDTVVAQGCRPIGPPLFVTRCRRNVVLELDGRPALDVLEDVHAQLPARDLELFRHSLFFGVVMHDARERYDRGDFLIRNLIGVDPEARALAVGTQVRPHQVVQFHLRDATTSAEELDALLGDAVERGPTPAAALLFSCVGRGVGLYGQTGHDSGLLCRHFGEVPVGGFFCNGEIGPVQGRHFLHGYTSSFALLRRGVSH